MAADKWKLVPVEPTPEMIDLGNGEVVNETAREVWEAMLTAAPKPQAEFLHPATLDLVNRFAFALKCKLADAERKYGCGHGWVKTNWAHQCRAELIRHIAKGDPIDVAAYCAFLWHHGESTASAAAPPAVAQQGVLTKEQVGALEKACGLLHGLGKYAEAHVVRDMILAHHTGANHE